MHLLFLLNIQDTEIKVNLKYNKIGGIKLWKQ